MSEDDINHAIENAEHVTATLDPQFDFDLKQSKHVYNDLGNARRFKARFGDDLMYVRHVGWYAWVGTHWDHEEGENIAKKRAHQTAQAMWGEARAMLAEGPNKDKDESAEAHGKRVQKHRDWAVQSGNSRRMSSMLMEAQPYLTREVEELDADPFLFNVQNGTLDIRLAKPLKKHDRKDLITRISPTKYSPEARCESFNGFMQSIVPDENIQVFLQRYFGYSMTGDTREQVLMLCVGEGANGKSTLCDMMAYICGDYVAHLSFASLLHDDRRRGGDATPDLARLPGARMVLAAEPELGARFSESTVKSLTGGEAVTARHLNQGFFEFTPQFKLVLAANHKPNVRGQDEGIWRRVLLTPFDQTIPMEQRDRLLKQKLQAEAPGILNWMLDGARMWLEGGLEVPEVISEAVADYRAENDPVGSFLDSCTREVEGSREQAKVLYMAYCTWCEENAVQAFNQTVFGKKLTDKGIAAVKSGVIYRAGIELLQEYYPGNEGGTV